MIIDQEDIHDLLTFVHAVQWRAKYDVACEHTHMTIDERKYAIITAIVENAEVNEL